MTGSVAEPLQSSIPIHSDRPSESTPSDIDPLLNVAGKALHLDAVIVKQEAGWFQLWEEKGKRKATEKVALQLENERVAKKEDQRHTIAYLQELL